MFSCQSSKLNALNKQYGELQHSQASCLEAMVKRNEASIKWHTEATNRAMTRYSRPISPPFGYGPDKVNEVMGQ
jgi:hypothetical protein